MRLSGLVHLLYFHLVNYIKMRKFKNEFKTVFIDTDIHYLYLLHISYICCIFATLLVWFY